ncbi:MAG: FAD-dependent oxidoreductase [Bacilli bacterium]|jgi:NADPH-dependent glutamate synthase beta subunit-like oxidoreductase/NAD-dependent dihydropyrimidine dehydrogenase PreA subunit|nr:FAD-dependent oxidoreductase [Bacilli bacterium]
MADEVKLQSDQKHAEERYKNGKAKNVGMAPGTKERKIITRLCNHIQDLPGVVVRPGDPEYNALACCVSDEEAKVALTMKLRKHYSLPTLCKKNGMSPEKLLPILEHAALLGLLTEDPTDPEVEPGPDGKPQKGFWYTIFVPGILEAMVGNVELVEKYPIIAESFSEYTIRRIIPLTGNLPVGHGVMRVIPVESAIKDNPKHTVGEEVSHYVESATDICVSNCSCRVTRRLQGEGCGHLEKDMCLQFNEAARDFIKTGRGRRISKEECYAIIKKAEDNGLMHEYPNIDGEAKTHAICNCCGCSCFSLRTGEYFHTNTLVRSNYCSIVDPDKCVACGECVEVCPMNALRMGERLENKRPIPIAEPQRAYDYKWGADKWNPYYRYDREYVMRETGTAPCKLACPAHISIEGYIELAKEGRYAEALELIKKKNPFPAVCGRVCNKACEDACTRGAIDEAVSIDEIKKFVAQLDLDPKTRVLPRVEHPEFHDIKMAVIGAGPAGLSCAYYLAAKGYSVTVFEKERKLGGMLTLGIPSFRLEKDVVNAEIDVIKDMGVEFKTGVEVGKDVTIPGLKKDGFVAIYVAIGAQGGRKLGVEGEDAKGIVSGIDFLRSVNLGKGERLHGKVIVMGSGNVAIDVARTAVRSGAKTVEIYCLESRDAMPAAKDEIAEAEEEGVKINNMWGVKEFRKDEKGHLKEAVLKKCVSVFDADHRFNPTYDEKSTIAVPCDFFLAAIGQSFEWGQLLAGTKCVVSHGRLQADPLTYQTDDPDVFVGGDCYHGARFAIDAIATGREGAESMHRHAHEGQSLIIGRAQNPYLAKYELDKDNIDVQGWDNAPRQEPAKIKVADKMRDDRSVFTEKQLKAECARCLKCGRTFVDETMCVGCGLCTTRCKFDAIHLERRFNEPGVVYEKIAPSSVPHILARNVKILFTGKGKPKKVAKDEAVEAARKRKESIR